MNKNFIIAFSPKSGEFEELALASQKINIYTLIYL